MKIYNKPEKGFFFLESKGHSEITSRFDRLVRDTVYEQTHFNGSFITYKSYISWDDRRYYQIVVTKDIVQWKAALLDRVKAQGWDYIDSDGQRMMRSSGDVIGTIDDFEMTVDPVKRR